MMRSFLDIASLSHDDLISLLDLTHQFKQGKSLSMTGQVASLFYENSTRTRVSFELAAIKLGLTPILIDIEHSSEAKGETVKDTIQTLHAMGIDSFVMRHKSEGLIHDLNEKLEGVRFVNAGDGKHSHPTQTLLDLYTMQQQLSDFSQAKVVVVGDIVHSRVANSLVCGLVKLGVGELVFCAPDYFLPEKVNGAMIEPDLKIALKDADVVMGLRVQKERFSPTFDASLDEYICSYQLSSDTLSYAKPDAVVMHPGPMNREVEITSELADSQRSLIWQQVKNGVYARMAVLSSLTR